MLDQSQYSRRKRERKKERESGILKYVKKTEVKINHSDQIKTKTK